jgi:hypothetical protein
MGVTKLFTSALVLATTLLPSTLAFSSRDSPNFRNKWLHPPNPGQWDHLRCKDPPSPSGPHLNVTLANSTFEQLIDHKNPGLGTFSQFYYWSTQHWGGPGYPVILMTPGEINVTGYQSYTTVNRTTGVLAQKIGAAVIVIEHRYWGTSSPYAELTTKNLRFLTLENSIADLVYFARTAKLPFDGTNNKKSNAPHIPWVLAGGSYSGALTAWTASTSPGTFYAYHASSAVVEITGDFWQYFLPVQENMPKNCSLDVSKVIDRIDSVGMHGTEAEKQAMKELFNMGGVEHYDDFAASLENGPWLWQGNQFYRTTGFFDWCDAVENVDNTTAAADIPGANGVGVDKALKGYAKYWNESILPGFCAGYGYYEGDYNVDCFNTYNFSSPMYRDDSLANTYDRQWVWMTCNEPFGYWQTGAPAGRPSIVSRYSNKQYWERQCGLYFPPEGEYKVGLQAGRTYEGVNKFTGGW